MNIFGHNERKFIPEPVVVSINDNEKYTEYYDKRVGINYKISNLSYPDKKYYPEELNSNFTIYEDTGFLFEDYAEFMLEYKYDNTSDIEEMNEFNIGSVIIKVQEPTPLLAKALWLEGDNYFMPEELTSISLKGVKKRECRSILTTSTILNWKLQPIQHDDRISKSRKIFR